MLLEKKWGKKLEHCQIRETVKQTIQSIKYLKSKALSFFIEEMAQSQRDVKEDGSNAPCT